MKRSGWDAHHRGARGHGSQDDRTGSYHREITDVHTWQNHRSDADMGGLTDRYSASEKRTGRDMHVIADHAIVLYNCRCVHNAILSDLSARIDHDFRHDNGSTLNSGRLRYYCGWVDESYRQETVF
jgi:metal-dependent amidase/aminoacylase/carboxypeptidase family protein